MSEMSMTDGGRRHLANTEETNWERGGREWCVKRRCLEQGRRVSAVVAVKAMKEKRNVSIES